MSDKKIRYKNKALQILKQGYIPLPLKPGHKGPVITGWPDIKIDKERVSSWAENGQGRGGIGIRMGEADFMEETFLIAVDIDIRDRDVARDMIKLCFEILGQTVVSVGEPPKAKLFYRLVTGDGRAPRKRKSARFTDPAGLGEHHVEMLGKGQQAAIYGLHPDTKKEYFFVELEFEGESFSQSKSMGLLDVPIEELPRVGEDQVSAVLLGFEEKAKIFEWKIVGESSGDSTSAGTEVVVMGDDDIPDLKPKLGATLGQARAWLQSISSRAEDYDTWIGVGMALFHEGDGTEEWYELWDDWSAGAASYDGPGDTREKWETFTVAGERIITMRSLRMWAQQAEEREAMAHGMGIQGAVDEIREGADQGVALEVRESADRVMARLHVDDNGRVYKTLNNLLAVLAHDDQVGLLRYNDMSRRIEIGGGMMEDHDVLHIKAYLAREYGAQFVTALLHEATAIIATRNRYHPIQDYLGRLEWDGVKRIGELLPRGCGAERSAYTEAVTEAFMIGALQRVLEPGCKMDYMLILEGPQGMGKSKVLEALCHDRKWFSDSQLDVNKPNAAKEQINGIWIYELAEMETAKKADIRSLKTFMSSKVDRYRPPYGRLVVDIPRSCVFVGSTNEAEYLNDPTGARRFWPVKVRWIKPEWVREHRDQLWAEALERMRAGGRPYLSLELEEEAERHQSERYESDEWENAIKIWLHEGEVKRTTCEEIVHDVFAIERGMITRIIQNRVGAVMQRLGYKRESFTNSAGHRVKGYIWTGAGSVKGMPGVAAQRRAEREKRAKEEEKST